jgi:CDP-glucose 4,6-dehydratase
MFEALDLARQCDHIVADIRDGDRLTAALLEFDPEIIFHLAAQPLVRRAYREPVETFATNVLGTVNLLQSARNLKSLRMIVVITSDKCYEDVDGEWPLRETDSLGGRDPYSASKACTEIAVTAYRASYFSQTGAPRLITVRAGNVIGGGDWSQDRLVPDAVRAFSAGQPLRVRNPDAVRPWQHVVEALAGYLLLVDHVIATGKPCPDALNFGPAAHAVQPVSAVVDALRIAWGEDVKVICEAEPGAPHEAKVLMLDSTRAARILGWSPRLDLACAIELTVRWYREYYAGASPEAMRQLTTKQIDEFLATA